MIDYYRCPFSKELARMYGSDSRVPKVKTMKDAIAHVGGIRDNELEWCIGINWKYIGHARPDSDKTR